MGEVGRRLLQKLVCTSQIEAKFDDIIISLLIYSKFSEDLL